MESSLSTVRIGCAGWSVPAADSGAFPPAGSVLERYAGVFHGVEINTSFYRSHRPSTYARWAESTPPAFRFSVKMPREITHRRRLQECGELLSAFLEETGTLGEKRGPILMQLPPSFDFDADRARAFFQLLRSIYGGLVVCEPRHPSWFEPEADFMLKEQRIARAAVDPAPVTAAEKPGGWPGLTYYRLHGSPRIYYSAYDHAYLERLAFDVSSIPAGVERWCIFDNTASGAATANALSLSRLLESQ